MGIEIQKQEELERAKSLVRAVKGFKVILSTKHDIQCEADELKLVTGAIQSGNAVKLKRGMFNPSYYVAIVEDEERVKKAIDEIWETHQNNVQCLDYGRNSFRKYPEFKSLKDIFEGVDFKMTPSLGSGNKQLNGGKE